MLPIKMSRLYILKKIYMGKNKLIADTKNASAFLTCSVVMDKKGQITDGVVPQRGFIYV